MTNQDKIAYLKQYKYLDNHIKRLLEEKERYQTIAEKITPTLSDMPHGGTGENPKELAICKMMDCERVATRMIDDYINLGNEIKALIDTVEDDDLRLLLLYRYIDGKTFEQVAVDMCYTWRWIHKLHSKALDKLDILIHI